jgi:hypothetical protein
MGEDAKERIFLSKRKGGEESILLPQEEGC